VGRAGNVVIGGDFHSSSRTNGGGRIFVDCYEALAEGRAPEIYSPKFTRPYTYGLDILSGYMTLMSQLQRPEVAGQAFNFGPREQYGVPNSVLAGKICELWGSGVMWRSGTPREEPFEFQSLSIRKSDEVLGWRPAFTLDEALRDTTEWYRAWAAMGDSAEPGCMSEINEQLFEQYESAARQVEAGWAVGAQA
jgi:CDP-glucose 4,6-dehydratase